MTTESAPEVKVNGTAPTPDPPKRGRGRPPGSRNKGPEGLSETPVGGEAPKRGRPRKERVELDQASVSRQLYGSHMMVGTMLGMPELFLTQKEADSMAEALVGFSREYDFEPDPKLMASINLIATAGLVYVPKVIAIAKRVKETKRQKPVTIEGEATVTGGNDDKTAAIN